MKLSKIGNRIIFGLLAALTLSLFIPQTVFCQKEKLGIVSYTPPKGWTKTSKVENVLAFSDIKPTGVFGIITLYGATPSTGNPTVDFTSEWSRLVEGLLKPDENPKPDAQSAEGWTILSGGSPVAGKALAFLTVISGYGQTVSVLAVFNDPAYVKHIDNFVSALEMDKPATPASPLSVAADSGSSKQVTPADPKPSSSAEGTLSVSGTSAQEFTVTADKKFGAQLPMDMPGLNGNPHAIIVATQVGSINQLPIGVLYNEGKWHIVNLHNWSMNDGAKYTVRFVPQADSHQFIHLVNKQNLEAEGSYLDNHALNNKPGAQFKVLYNRTPGLILGGGGGENQNEVKAVYDTAVGRWYIANINGKPLRPNAAFNIIIIP